MLSEREAVLLLKELYRCRDRLDAVCRVLEVANWSRCLAEVVVSDLLSTSLRLKAITNVLMEEYGLLEGGRSRRGVGRGEKSYVRESEPADCPAR